MRCLGISMLHPANYCERNVVSGNAAPIQFPCGDSTARIQLLANKCRMNCNAATMNYWAGRSNADAKWQRHSEMVGAPGRIRTFDFMLRRHVLGPAELRAD